MARGSKNSSIQRWEAQKSWMKQYSINQKSDIFDKSFTERRVIVEKQEELLVSVTN